MNQEEVDKDVADEVTEEVDSRGEVDTNSSTNTYKHLLHGLATTSNDYHNMY